MQNDPMNFAEAFSASTNGAVSVPREALHFNVGEFAISDKNGEGAKSAPVTLKARSGESIDHWYWGRVVHDLAGMKMEKNRVAIDWNHDPDQLIGYLNKFDITSGDLVASGALVPYGDECKATEIIYKASQGVPYEASISFPGGDQAIEVIGEKQIANVNGRTFEGPGVIFREWTLRGVAICAMGADHRTSADFSDEEKVFSVRVISPAVLSNEGTEEQVMNAEAEQVVDADAVAEVVEEVVEEVADEVTVEETPEQLRAAEGKRFVEAFGAEGAMMFALGKSFEVARDEFTAKTIAENAELKAKVEDLEGRLSAFAARGEAPVTGSVATPEPVEETYMLAAERIKAELDCTMTEAFRQAQKRHPELYKIHRSGK